jgi:hypothetical protein
MVGNGQCFLQCILLYLQQLLRHVAKRAFETATTLTSGH